MSSAASILAKTTQQVIWCFITQKLKLLWGPVANGKALNVENLFPRLSQGKSQRLWASLGYRVFLFPLAIFNQPKGKQKQSHVSVGSISMNSTNLKWKIFEKHLHLYWACTGFFFLSLFPEQCRMTAIYIALGIRSNVDMILSIQEDVHRLYANTPPLYVSDLSICRFWCPWGILEPCTLRDDCM
jgi:hypothetical protein